MEQLSLHAAAFFFGRIIMKVANNQDRYQSSGKFEFGLLVSIAKLTLLRCVRLHTFPSNYGLLKKLQTKDVFVLTMYAEDETYGKNIYAGRLELVSNSDN